MRLWSLHPRYLDAAGLVALWREALLAQKVLRGGTKGYTRHPQLERFRRHPLPLEAVASYLECVHAEATCRRYRFDKSRIHPCDPCATPIAITDSQLAFELEHLRKKLKTRDPERFVRLENLILPEPHPLFLCVPGPIESWERVRNCDDSSS
jgi:hypothetical protein